MKFKAIYLMAFLLLANVNVFGQCLNGGCEVGISRESIKDGVFVGHYEDGAKQGLGISYVYNPKGEHASYAHYDMGKKNGVEYTRFVESETNVVSHTFQTFAHDVLIYPAIRITKLDKRTKIDVKFNDTEGWQKYDGDETKGELAVKSLVHNGSPVFMAFHNKSQTMAVSATVASISLLSSEVTEKYYNALQMDLNDDRLVVDIFPKAGADRTSFRTSLDWNMNEPDEGLWLYRRYFNDKLSYRMTYDEVLELPSEKEIKQQKVQKAFDFIAQQVEEYDFEKGYAGRAQDFIDLLNDTKFRAQSKGYEIPKIYDLTLVQLYLQMGDKEKSLHYARTACDKSAHSYKIINELITTKYQQHTDLLTAIQADARVAAEGN